MQDFCDEAQTQPAVAVAAVTAEVQMEPVTTPEVPVVVSQEQAVEPSPPEGLTVPVVPEASGPVLPEVLAPVVVEQATSIAGDDSSLAASWISSAPPAEMTLVTAMLREGVSTFGDVEVTLCGLAEVSTIVCV